ANRLARRVPTGWTVAVVDPEITHVYQPGLLFLPFGARDEAAMLRPRRQTLSADIEWHRTAVDHVETTRRAVVMADGEELAYDVLVLATGARLRFDLTPGIDEGRSRGNVHDFYTLLGAQALREKLDGFTEGRVVVNVVEMPIKCPVAPLEFLFLADAFFEKKGVRDRIELVYATPLDGAFTRPIASRLLSEMLERKRIVVEKEMAAAEVDAEAGVLRSYDEREVPFDLLVTIPTHSGAEYVERSGLGNELAFVPTDRNTLLVEGQENVFALGDTTNLPSSKAGSVAHFQAEVLEENILRTIEGKSLLPGFDGHANCFVESGHDKALLIDFNYDVEPLPGRYPVPGVGPFTLLGESRANHYGKLAFRWMYWNGLLPGKPIPVPTRMSMTGKRRPAAEPVRTA
ncbi:MAG: NAD(P)/FAD-dependent oxidoreductase, partial [Deltaproteobacteria bacterium]|nr:NAD(P)/FAD-dependent oxidoreductase [Deltaproteobacteria bacterium]